MTTKRGLASPCVHSALATTRRWQLQLLRVVHMKSLKRRAGRLVREPSALASSIPRRCTGPAGYCGPGRTGSRRRFFRTRPSVRRERSRNRRAARCGPWASAGAPGPRCARSPQPSRRPHRCWRAAAWRTKGDHRRRRRAAGSSSGRSSRGRNAPPGRRAVDRPWHPDPARSLRRGGVCVQEQIDEQCLDRRRVVADLVIARRLRPAQLQSVECRLAGHRRAVL